MVQHTFRCRQTNPEINILFAVCRGLNNCGTGKSRYHNPISKFKQYRLGLIESPIFVILCKGNLFFFFFFTFILHILHKTWCIASSPIGIAYVLIIVKLGFTRAYISFLISVQKHRLLVLVRTASPRRC